MFVAWWTAAKAAISSRVAGPESTRRFEGSSIVGLDCDTRGISRRREQRPRPGGLCGYVIYCLAQSHLCGDGGCLEDAWSTVRVSSRDLDGRRQRAWLFSFLTATDVGSTNELHEMLRARERDDREELGVDKAMLRTATTRVEWCRQLKQWRSQSTLPSRSSVLPLEVQFGLTALGPVHASSAQLPHVPGPGVLAPKQWRNW